MSSLAPYHPDQPEHQLPFTSHSSPPDEPIDYPAEDEIVRQDEEIPTSIPLPRLILGCATFGYGIYAKEDDVLSDLPVRIVRLALRSGVTAFDTSPWYHPSEQILGRALSLLRPPTPTSSSSSSPSPSNPTTPTDRSKQTHFPRESYQIITKVGKYGPTAPGHTFAPDVVEKSVRRSLERFDTDYLDVVYLHDVEFLSSTPLPPGNPLLHLPSILSSPPSTSLSPGEQEILAGISRLRQLQSLNLIHHIGIAGYPLPTLLRISLLVLSHTGRPIDIVQSYAHHTLANTCLVDGYLDALTRVAKVGRIVSASPLGMGLLTRRGLPGWHPAKESVLEGAAREVVGVCERWGRGVEEVACEFGYRGVWHAGGEEGGEAGEEVGGRGSGKGDGRGRGRGKVPVPIVVGCKSLEELHSSLKSFSKANASVQGGDEEQERIQSETAQLESEIRDVFERTGSRNWSWQSPPE